MLSRHAQSALIAALRDHETVALLGPRRCGKTTLAREIARTRPSVWLDLDREEDVRLLSGSGALGALTGKLVILDEAQALPGLLARLQSLLDTGRRNGREIGPFLLLGSSRRLLHGSGLAVVELAPLGLDEIGAEAQELLWLRGGLPGSLEAETDRASLEWRHDILRSGLDRDLLALGPRISGATLRRLSTMLAHRQGDPLNAAQLAEGLGISGQTVARHLDLLVDLMLVRRLTPWPGSTGKRLAKSPRFYVRDSGFAHALLGLESFAALRSHPIAEASWRGFCLEQLISAAAPGSEAFFYRSSGGAEIDLVLRLVSGRTCAIAVRRGDPRVSRGFHAAASDVGADLRLLVHADLRDVPIREGLISLPLPAALRLVRGLS